MYKHFYISTMSELIAITVSKTINADVTIRGEHLKTLEGVEKINGSLGISESSLESLGELKEITGGFWTSFHTVHSPLISLNNLEKIGEDAKLQNTNIADLGNLRYVGGRLILRGTKISSLGKVEYVGGNLFISKHLKDSIDLGSIQIKGKVQFWNDNNKNKIEIVEKTDLGLINSDKPVPYWEHQYVYSAEVLNNANIEQSNFYYYFKESFLQNKFIDICGNDNYSFVLYFDLISDFNKQNDIDWLQEQFGKLKTYYPKTGNYAEQSLVELFEKRGDFENAWKLKYKSNSISIPTIWEYQQKLQKPLLDGELIVRFGSLSYLTMFGQRNIEQIKPFTEEYLKIYEKEKGSGFFELFFDKNKLHKVVKNNRYSPTYYQKFYSCKEEFNIYKSFDEGPNAAFRRGEIKFVVRRAILNQCQIILKKAEDLYRASIGMPKVGEGWISEAELFYKIATTFSEFEVVHHGKPEWLGRQHLDIFFPGLDIGVEYQGTQHFEAVDFFGGVEGFEAREELDQKKKDKCLDNNCVLIYVMENYDYELVIEEIKRGIQTRHKSTLIKAQRIKKIIDAKKTR